jgi:predicted Zn finger-like uncharacterized protein
MGMALKSGRSLRKECENCGAVYNVMEESYPTQEKGFIKCEHCGNVIHKWNGGRVCETKKVSGPTVENFRKLFDEVPS